MEESMHQASKIPQIYHSEIAHLLDESIDQLLSQAAQFVFMQNWETECLNFFAEFFTFN